jgi:hypothetical protein
MLRRSWWGVVLACGVCCWASGVALGSSSGRQFELVSPVYKGGFGATFIEGVAQDGDSAAFYSPGVFNGAQAGLSNNINTLDYLSRRGSSGWSTEPIAPPDELVSFVDSHDISTTLEETLAMATPGPNLEAANLEGTENDFFLHATNTADVSPNWGLLGSPLKTLTDEPFELKYEGASANFCHVLFVNPKVSTEERGELLAKAKGSEEQVYELAGGCNGEEAALRLVSVDDRGNVISPLCPAEIGVYGYYGADATAYNAVSADGSEAFFTTCIGNNDGHHQLFVRLGASKTVEISKPLTPTQPSEACGNNEIPCKGAEGRASSNFAGASEDGSKVFFTTTSALVPEDKDTGSDLYMASLGCPSTEMSCVAAERRVTGLVQVSHDPSGGEASVQGVVRVAPDGARVYFVATGDLLGTTEQKALEGESRAVPAAGAENLYVYDAVSGSIAFIGDLCSGSEGSGTVSDAQCPNGPRADTTLWSRISGGEVQTAGADGRYLVFSTYAQLTASDTDAAKDVYRYDAETGILDRVSGGEAGYDANGNGEFDATITPGRLGHSVREQYELNSRAISEDGKRIIFFTAESLSAQATNHLVNVYEWHEGPGEGGVSLISSGTATTPVEDAVIAPEGNDVFFVTTQGLVPQDVDGAPDVYDARVGGGFPQAPSAREECSGDACQGPLTNPAPLLVPGSIAQVPGENFEAPQKPVPKPKAKTKAKQKKKRKKRAKKDKAKKAALVGGGRHNRATTRREG